MKVTTKRVLTIVITVICSVVLTLIIGFFPSGEEKNENITNEGYEYDQNADAVTEAPEGDDYESMSKEELLAVIEEKDAEINELVDKVEALTILAEQTTNSIVVPTPSGSSSDVDEDEDSTEDDSSSDSDSSSSGSSGGGSSGNGSSGGSGNGTTSDTGL